MVSLQHVAANGLSAVQPVLSQAQAAVVIHRVYYIQLFPAVMTSVMHALI